MKHNISNINTKIKDDYKVKIGLENHIKVNVKRKLFCFCVNDSKASLNTNICAICLGSPGTLPTLNMEVISYAARLVKLLNCKIAENIMFDRKHYNYPDLPKSYQITQLTSPIGKGGELFIGNKTINIMGVSIEEDAAKSSFKDGKRIIDYNRSGTPLLELVTHPDCSDSSDVMDYLKYLKMICESLNIIDGTLSDCIRCDVNISVSTNSVIGERVEIKNLNSLSDIVSAIDYEIERQIKVLNKEEKVKCETRSWDEKMSATVSMRDKENVSEYMFLPENDMPVIPYSLCAKMNNTSVEDSYYNNFAYSYRENVLFSCMEGFDQDRKNKLFYLIRYIRMNKLISFTCDKSLCNSIIDCIFEVIHAVNSSNYIISPKELDEKIGTLISYLEDINFRKDVVALVKKTPLKVISQCSNIIDLLPKKAMMGNAILSSVIEHVMVEYKDAVLELKNGDNKVLNFLFGQCLKTLKNKYGEMHFDLSFIKNEIMELISKI